MRAILLSCLALGASCDENSAGPAIDPPTTAAVGGAITPTNSALVCPVGSRLSGGAPPTNTKEFCVRDVDGSSPVRDGPFRLWDQSGHKIMEGIYSDGKLSGSVSLWATDGKKIGEGPMNADAEKHGRWKEWQPEKNAELTGEYVNGLKEGEWTTIQGGTRIVGEFKKGKAEGVFVAHEDATDLKNGETMMTNGEVVWTMAWSPLESATVKKCFFKKGTQDRCETFIDVERGTPSRSECDGAFRAEKPKMEKCTGGCPGGADFPRCMDRCAARQSKLFAVCYKQQVASE